VHVRSNIRPRLYIMTTKSSAKRINRTKETYAPGTITNAQTDTQSDELTARLQNIGARVRKSVTEGYLNASAPTSPCASPTKPKAAPPSEARIFQSANDTLREVYSAIPLGGYRPPQSSPNKRERARSKEPDDRSPENSDAEMQISESEAAENTLPTFAEFDARPGEARPVKPLKRSGRQFAETRSLPARSFRFSSDMQSMDRLPDLVTKSIDEDWSEDPLAMRSIQAMDFD